MFVDMANMTIHGTSEFEVGKKGNLPFDQGCPRLQKKMTRMDTNIKIQRIWSTTTHNAKLK